MVYVLNVVKAFPEGVGVFGVGVRVDRDFNVVQVAFEVLFGVCLDCLKFLRTLFGVKDAGDDFFQFGVIVVRCFGDAVLEVGDTMLTSVSVDDFKDALGFA